VLEAQARQDLESEGCPPCYPPDLDIPIRNPPEKYQAIIGYWYSLAGTGDVVLCAQRSDWRRFRASQPRARARYRNKPFSEFVEDTRERRRRYRLGGDISLQLDPEQQSQLENWTEYQNYHLKRLEQSEKKQVDLERQLEDAQKKAKDTDTAASQPVAHDIEVIPRILGIVEWDLQRLKVLLQWIENERQAMDLGHRALVEDGGDDHDTAPKAVRRTSTRARKQKG